VGGGCVGGGFFFGADPSCMGRSTGRWMNDARKMSRGVERGGTV